MRVIRRAILALAALGLAMAGPALGKDIKPMYGGWMTAGYDWGQKPQGPRGSIAYDVDRNEFKGTYTGLHMPPGRRAIFAWLHDTVNQKTRYLGAVGWLKLNTGGQDKGRFTIKADREFKGGNFGSFEIIAFSSERTTLLEGNKVLQRPTAPSGNKVQNPAFYLFAALPGADTTQIFCGHGQDFSFAKAPDKQRCYD